MTLFHEIIYKRVDGPRRKLTRLVRYTKGDAKEMISMIRGSTVIYI